MPKKSASNITDFPPSEEAPRPNWPEATENRVLRCDLSPQEATQYGKEQAELIQAIDSLEEQKKASASHYKAAIEEKGARARRIGSYITYGWLEKDVQCQWVYETAGRDSSNGEMIYHPEKKTLVRCDTGEVVEIHEITNEERQLALPLDQSTEEEV